MIYVTKGPQDGMCRYEMEPVWEEWLCIQYGDRNLLGRVKQALKWIAPIVGIG